MPKEVDVDCVSESSYNDIPLEQCIRETVKDLQTGLNELESALIALIYHDEIEHEAYGQIYYLSREYVDISKELVNIVKSFKPAGWKAPKITMDDVEKQQKMCQ